MLKAATISAGLLVAAPAFAQTAPAAPSQTAPAAALTIDSPIEALMASPIGRAAVLKQLPDLDKHPAYDQFKGMSLVQLAPLAGGIITDEKLAAITADLKAGK